jgi:hypothetical protein
MAQIPEALTYPLQQEPVHIFRVLLSMRMHEDANNLIFKKKKARCQTRAMASRSEKCASRKIHRDGEEGFCETMLLCVDD